MKFDSKKIMPRYFVIIVLMSLGGLYILGSAAHLMTSRKEYWETVSTLLIQENIPLPAKRGNILAADGQIMATTLPEFNIYMDYVAFDRDSTERCKLQHWRDSMLNVKMDSICKGLHKIFPDKTVKHFRERLEEGRKHKRRNWMIYKKRITYIQYQECLKLPLLRERSGKGGFYAVKINKRKRPFGSLACRTVGDVYVAKDSARFGLELSFDSILKGKPGKSHTTKVRNKWLRVEDEAPVDGFDILTTIDVSMQDAAEKALLKKLKEINGNVGVVVLMEVATGDVKAIVNMTKQSDGEYYEVKNNAVSDMMEPGSTFKTASIMVALEDKKITKDDFIETGNGQWGMYGRVMKDHNWRKGGYGRISLPEILMYSSNIGVSRIIDDHYKSNPEKYVEGLTRMGVGAPLHLPLVGCGEALIKHPLRNKDLWSKTTLPWMSIGYETMIPPISTLTFYNAIANNGKMVKPRFVKAEMKDGQTIREYPVEVINEKICSQHTLNDIREILEMVVSKGLGKQAGCKQFKVSGKTGTAQVSQGKKGYRSGTTNYLVSFCGFFPSEKPKYSCIVAIQKSGIPASGGGQCGPVFSEIAQAVMVKGVFGSPHEAADSASIFVPDVQNGNMEATQYILNELQIPYHNDWNKESIADNIVWGITKNNGNNIMLVSNSTPKNLVPDVTGCGARDAVYLMESRGMKVFLKGSGYVVSQSIAPNTQVAKGKIIKLELKKK